MQARKITVCGGGNGAQALVAVAACNLGCPVDLYAPLADEATRLQAGIAAHGGLETIGAALSEEPDTIMDVVEPYLLQLGFLQRTSQGRVATRQAYTHLDLDPPEDAVQPRLIN